MTESISRENAGIRIEAIDNSEIANPGFLLWIVAAQS
jgi:hypothetical protein